MKEIWIDPEIQPPINGIDYMYKGYAYYDFSHLTKGVGVIKRYRYRNEYYVYEPLCNIIVYAYRIR